MMPQASSAMIGVEPVPVEDDVAGVAERLGVPAGAAARWARYHAPMIRTLLVARAGTTVAGAAITASRPLASYLKVAGVWISGQAPDRDDVERALLAAAEELAWAAGHVVVKREMAPAGSVRDAAGVPGRSGVAIPAAPDRAVVPGSSAVAAPAVPGYAVVPGYADVPVPAIPGPIPDPAPPVPAAQFRWRTPSARAAVPYMRQTTDFTCGTACLSMVLAHRGLIEATTRATELELWRQATTIMACDPYGLAVTAARRGLRPEVTVSTESALFLERVATEQDRELRRFIQADFRGKADAAGIAAQRRTFDVAEVRDVVGAGGQAIVLVDELLVHGEPCPHWILVHGLEGEHFVAHDPWTEVSKGESWLDGYDVPLSAAALDRLAWTGDPASRAMVTFSR